MRAYYIPNWAQASSKSVCFWAVNRAILSSSIYTEGEIKRANVKFYIADALGDQWLNSINHQFKVKIQYAR